MATWIEIKAPILLLALGTPQLLQVTVGRMVFKYWENDLVVFQRIHEQSESNLARQFLFFSNECISTQIRPESTLSQDGLCLLPDASNDCLSSHHS